MTDEFNTLRIDERDDRMVVRLHRPEQRNAINREMTTELHSICQHLETTPKLAIITGGADGFFAAGADIADLRDRDGEGALAGVNLRLFERIRALPMPTIAAIDGYALGGGAELSYACDIRLVTPRTVFGQPEPSLGIIAGAGAPGRLVRLLGESVAKHVLLAARKLDADDAVRLGLALESVPPEELLTTAHALADRMLKQSALALRLTKLVTDSPPDAHPNVDLTAQAILFESDEKHRRMTDFLNRRK